MLRVKPASKALDGFSIEVLDSVFLQGLPEREPPLGVSQRAERLDPDNSICPVHEDYQNSCQPPKNLANRQAGLYSTSTRIGSAKEGESGGKDERIANQVWIGAQTGSGSAVKRTGIGARIDGSFPRNRQRIGKLKLQEPRPRSAQPKATR